LTVYAEKCIFRIVKVIQVYKCFCDELRLRILNLLQEGPLCVCHLGEILGCDQVKMSKQLRYMKELGMVEAERQAQWMIYRLATPENPLVAENLKCLQDCADTEQCLAEDLRKRAAVMNRLRADPSAVAPALFTS
jgi:ArsR family transcriptional regulator